MSILKFRIIFILMAIGLPNAFGQTATIIEDLSVYEDNGKIYLQWTITSGNTCDGILILRSTDTINYIQIGEIPGVCGSSSSAVTYSFVDDHPVKNKVNHYRIDLGGSGHSGNISYEIIDIAGRGYQIRPHPATNQADLFFSNDKNLESRLILYNLNGIALLTEETMEAYFHIDTSSLLSGIYYFQILSYDNFPHTVGKFVVQH